MARKADHYKTKSGDTIVGLIQDAPGRWRILETHQRFREDDSTKAIARFRRWQASVGVIPASVEFFGVPASPKEAALVAALENTDPFHENPYKPVANINSSEGVNEIGFRCDPALFYGAVRKLLLNNPKLLAERTSLPALARFVAADDIAHVKIISLIASYEKFAPGGYSKTRSVKALRRLMAHSGAVVLGDLTTKKLIAFRDYIEADKGLKEGSSRAFIYSKCKGVIKFGLKRGFDAEQITACLARMKVLYTDNPQSQIDPHPISPENLAKLLDGCVGKNAAWKAWILLGLNCALKMIDICRMQWSMIDIKRGTYSTIREKTKREKVPQAAVLWEETLEALKAIKADQIARKIETKLVFLSGHGRQWNRQGKGNEFARLRDLVGAVRENGEKVCFDDLVDGACSAAALAGIPENLCQVMKGHKCGMKDHYVLRNPAMVAPANAAVHAFYFVKRDIAGAIGKVA